MIYAEGSLTIGAGHQVRAAALWGAFTERGHQVLLLARGNDHSPAKWAWNHLPHRLLPQELSDSELIESIRAEQVDCLIMDYYNIAGNAMKGLAPLTVMIDDIPTGRELGCDLVVNPSLGILVTDYTIPALVGPDYALIRPEFAIHRHVPPNNHRVLVMLGGTDHLNLGPAITRVLVLNGYQVELIGAKYDHPMVRSHERLDANGLSKLMASSACAVVSASTSSLESLAVGVPFVAIQTVDNQEYTTRGLRQLGFVPVIRPEDIMKIPGLISGLPAQGIRLIDGQGAARVASAIEKLWVNRMR